jgi:endonuclease/exonuclease/phosphatase family metal-dependent hydrolase
MDCPAALSDFSCLSAAHGSFSHRGPLQLARLRALDADIAALQECNHPEALGSAFSSTHSLFFVPKLSSLASPPDGCALLVKRSRLQVQAAEVLYYAASAAPPCSSALPPALSNQNAIVLTLLDVAAQRSLVVACTHLKAKEGAAEEQLRVQQVAQLTAACSRAQQRASASSACGTSSSAVPMLLAGDFNSYPGSAPLQSLQSTLGPLCSSAYSQCAFTTWKVRGSGAARQQKKVAEDYIFSCGSELQLSELLQLPSEEEIGEQALPCEGYPSDHLCIGARLLWR